MKRENGRGLQFSIVSDVGWSPWGSVVPPSILLSKRLSRGSPAVDRLIRHHIEYGQSGQRVQMKTLPVYGKQVIAVPLEMRVDSKHRNVGFLALSERCTVTSLTTAHSHNRTFALTHTVSTGHALQLSWKRSSPLPRLSAMVAISRSNWPRLRCRGTCSEKF